MPVYKSGFILTDNIFLVRNMRSNLSGILTNC
jgi:hypothetical protein